MSAVDFFVKVVFKAFMRRCFRVSVRGLEHYASLGPKAIIVANHVSYLDAVLLGAFLPQRLMFAVNTQISQKWWVRCVMWFADTCTIDRTNPMSMKSMVQAINAGRHCVIFPEGRMTLTGSLMKLYEGPGLVADKTGAMVLPVCIRGAQYSYFSRLKHKTKLRLFPKITMTILPPQQLTSASKNLRVRRQEIAQQLYDLMLDLMLKGDDLNQNIWQRLVEIAQLRGRRHVVYEDVQRQPMRYGRLIFKAHALAAWLQCRMMNQPDMPIHGRVGVLLPTTQACMTSFFALLLCGAVPTMLNFGVGERALTRTAQRMGLRYVLTSRRFVAQAQLEGMVTQCLQLGMCIIYLEDCITQTTAWQGLRSWVCARWPALFLRARLGRMVATRPAVILLTSGSEGAPKGVALSHRQILANVAQVIASAEFKPDDIVFNALPLFHSFGLVAGALLPALTGLRAFLYPNPLHYRVIPELVYDTHATVFFSSNTFLMGYAAHAHPYDFYSLRCVYAGAEALQDQTRRIWMERFGLRIFEGYGVTETSPVISVNTALANRNGTVGRLLPAMAYRLEPVDGMTEGGRLWVKGPNVMLGYVQSETHDAWAEPPDGWHDTGDIATVDDEGYIRIVGRAKRFAKLGGEMVSLSAVEHAIVSAFPEGEHALISVKDARKGERLLLITTLASLTSDVLLQGLRNQGWPELTIPRDIRYVDALPRLATGKVDYPALQ